MEEFQKILTDYVGVFTDGIKMENQVFGGFATKFRIGKEMMLRSRSFVSIFPLEAVAVLKALNVMFERPEKNIAAFSDSMSGLKVSSQNGQHVKYSNANQT